MILSRIAVAAILFSVLGATPFFAASQTPNDTGASPPSASILFRGQVFDAAGRPVPGAGAVAFREGETAPAASSSSNAQGYFTFTLSPGTYLVRVSRAGFTEDLQTVSITAEKSSARFTLSSAELRETITVNSSSSYLVPVITSGTKTPTALSDVPQSITIITTAMMQDQLMTGVGDVVQYVPGITLHQGENNRDQIVMRGNSSSADFFLNGVRDDVQYYRDLYNVERVEALKGPNAMMFGRGGAGGVINRVTKEAAFGSFRELVLEGGGQDNRRITGDVNEAVTEKAAIRLNGLYEDSGSFRHEVGLERYGLAPTLTLAPSDRTKITLGYEHLRDARVADRGITSIGGRPADVPVETFYGNPDDSRVRSVVDLATTSVEHRAANFIISNRTLFGAYDRFYQNYVPGAVTGAGTAVTLTAYNNATKRQNLFNQTNLTFAARSGAFQHTVLAGIEIGQQRTDNYRNTGFFGDGRTSLLVPYSNPTTTVKADFRQSATDSDNNVQADVAAVYAQDQMVVSDQLQFIAGVRLDRFDLRYQNHRTGDRLGRVDNLISPRAGVVFKPVSALSVYGSYSVSSLPSSGDQFSSLTDVTRQLEPEKITNYEIGTKWDAGRALSVTTAIYRLDRTNTRASDPNDPTRILQTGSQRTDGFELGVNGRLTRSWDVAGGYARQDARVTSATAAAARGARVGQVPEHTLSVWNKVRVSDRSGVGLGAIYRSAMFATIDNSVVLPGYTRFDGAAYFVLSSALRLQVNVENLLDRKYFANADSNTNISPGSPRLLRVALTATF